MPIKHEDPDRVYKLDEDQKKILDLASGRINPRNEDEREMLNDIKEIEANGYMIDLPFD